MSRIGKLPITIPNGVTVDVKGTHVKVKGSKGELEFTFHPRANIQLDGSTLKVVRTSEEKIDKSLHGVTRTLLSNMVEGVSKGYSKQLEIQGVGYRAQMAGSKLTLFLGFSHPIEFNAPKGIQITIDPEKKNIITVAGIDKQLVGEVAAKIREFKKPEPYKGKGIRYVGEYVQRKAGKAAASAK
ncbi:MAG: 50S ribosomal protein L6 [Candidatus Gracilibacteria bacterium]